MFRNSIATLFVCRRWFVVDRSKNFLSSVLIDFAGFHNVVSFPGSPANRNLLKPFSTSTSTDPLVVETSLNELSNVKIEDTVVNDVPLIEQDLTINVLIKEFDEMVENQQPSDKDITENVKDMLKRIAGEVAKMNISDVTYLLSVLKKLRFKVPLSEGNKRCLVELMLILDSYCGSQSSWHYLDRLNLLDDFRPLKLRWGKKFLASSVVKVGFKKMLKAPPDIFAKYCAMLNAQDLWNHYSINMYEIEYALINRFDEFSAHHLTHIVKGFCIHRTSIQDATLVDKLYNFLDKNFDSITSQELINFVTMLEIYTSSEKCHLLPKLFDKIDRRHSDLSFNCLLCCAKLATEKLYYEPRILYNFSKRYMQELQSLSTASIRDALAVFTWFNYDTNDDIYRKTLLEISSERRQEELLKFPKRTFYITYYLSMVNVYDLNIVNTVLSVEFLQLAFGKKLNKYIIPREVLSLNYNIQLDFPDYKGNQLEEGLLQSMLDFYCPKLSTNSLNTEPKKFYYKSMKDIQSTLDGIFGSPGFAKPRYVLPHLSRPGIVFSWDVETKTACSLPDDEMYFCPAPKDGKQIWYYVLILSRNPIFLLNEKPISTDIIKERQLPKLGYDIIKVFGQYFSDMTPEKRTEFFKKTLDLL